MAAGSVTLGQFSDLGADLFDKHDRPKAGYAVESEQKFTLALDTTLAIYAAYCSAQNKGVETDIPRA